MTDKPLYIPIKQCKDYFSLSRDTIYRAAARGEITIHKVGYRSLLKVSEIEVWIESAAATNPAAPEQEAALASPIAALLPDAVAQAEKAMRKFPQPNYVISKWAEETGEVTKALIHAAEDRETWANVRGELVDSLAMLHRLFVEGDQVHGLPALRDLAEQGEA